MQIFTPRWDDNSKRKSLRAYVCLFFVFLLFYFTGKAARTCLQNSLKCAMRQFDMLKKGTLAGLQIICISGTVFVNFFYNFLFLYEIFSLLSGRKKCIPNRIASFAPQIEAVDSNFTSKCRTGPLRTFS